MKRETVLYLGLGLLGAGLLVGGGVYVVQNRDRMNGPRYDRLLPSTKRKLDAHLAQAQAAGLDVMFFDGWRDPVASAKNISNGASKLTDPLDSFHVWGLAYDLAFRNAVGLPYWPPDSDPRWLQLAQMGPAVGMNSGGLMWGWDWGHFQEPGINIAALKSQYRGDYLSYLTNSGAIVA